MLGRVQGIWKSRGNSADLRDKFTAVYEKQIWGEHESRSGAGSVRGSPWVAVAFEAIAKAVREHDVRSINDIPCGDFNWMPELLAELGNVSYIGFDIVRAALSVNKDRHPNYEFRVLDITAKAPPAADLIFCKDLLNHLSEQDVRRAIANMRRSGSKYLLASNNPGFAYTPLPEGPGASRHLDITAPPFGYPAPLWSVADYLFFWRLADLREPGATSSE